MFKPENLPKTALITNGMVWFGVALLLAGIAGEQTWNAFHGEWYNIVGWVIISTAAVGTAMFGVVETRRLRARMKPARMTTELVNAQRSVFAAPGLAYHRPGYPTSPVRTFGCAGSSKTT